MKKTHVFLSSAFRDVNQGADNYVKTLVGEDLTASIALSLAEDVLKTMELCTVNSLVDNEGTVQRGPKWRIERVSEKDRVPSAVLAVYAPASIIDCDDDMEFSRNLPPWITVRTVVV